MRWNAFALLRAFGLVVGALMAAPAAAQDARVLVVPLHGKAGPAFDKGVVRLVEKPLKRHATVIGGAQAKGALRRARVRAIGLKLAKNVQKAGKAAAAKYVLVVEATGRKKNAAANVTLVEVKSGSTVFTDRYALPGGKITPEVAAQILSPVVDKLGAGGSDAPSEAGGGDADPADAPAKPNAKAGKSGGFKWPGGDKGPGGSSDPTEPSDATADGDDKGDKGSSEESVETSTTAKGEHGTRWRPALRLTLGGAFVQRNANLTPATATPGVTPPCYCGTGRNSNPFFPALRLALDLYPFAFTGNGDSAVEGLGLQAEMFVTSVKSYIDTSPSQVVSSVLFDFKGGVTFRYVLWDSTTAPDLDFNLGLAVFSFPLQSGAFPGVNYTSPYLGVSTHIPLGMEELALLGGFSYMPKLTAGNDAATMLGTQSGGGGYNLEGGLRFAFDRYEITALTRYQVYNTSFTGTTKFDPNVVPVQLSNVALKDSLLQIMVTAGMVF